MIEKAIETYLKKNMSRVASLFAKYMEIKIEYIESEGVIVFEVIIADVEICKDQIHIEKIIKKVVDNK